jgi:hypothetical protein
LSITTVLRPGFCGFFQSHLTESNRRPALYEGADAPSKGYFSYQPP